MIPYGRQEITQGDIDAVVEVLNSDFLTQGPKVPAFEQRVANHVDANFAIAVNSATSALHIACLALDLGSGDVLWTSPNTFVASANCALYCGADVDFVDIDPSTYNMCTKALERKLLQAELNGKLPKVVVPVHMCGQSCDMETISKLAKRFKFSVIEDASHAIGGKYQGKYVGSCRYSDITVFSFHPVKIITTAEGGMALTNDKQLAQKLDLYRSHGITRDPELMTERPHGPWYYQQITLGYNYRMTELQAALGIKQLTRLDDFVAMRHRLVARYNTELGDLPIHLPNQLEDNYSSFHLYVIRVPQHVHLPIFDELRRRGIGCNLHYIPVHTQPFYQQKGFVADDYPEAQKYYREAISLPLYPGLAGAKQTQVINVLREVICAKLSQADR